MRPHMADNPTPELLQALNKFQQSCISAHKDSTGYGYNYASEESINASIRPAKALGLVHYFICLPTGSEVDGKPAQTDVTLVVRHISGGEITSSLTVEDYDPNNKKDKRHQQRGSGISYAKRYLLAAMFGLATSENEGENLTPSETPTRAPKASDRPAPKGPKPKASGNPPAQAHAPAKQKEADPLVEQFENCKAAINGLIASHPKHKDHIKTTWKNDLKLRFNGSISVKDPSMDVLQTAEHFAWCQEWITNYKPPVEAASK